MVQNSEGKAVTKIFAQRSSKGEGGRLGRGNPPSRGAQVGFELINQSRRKNPLLSSVPTLLVGAGPAEGPSPVPDRGRLPLPRDGGRAGQHEPPAGGEHDPPESTIFNSMPLEIHVWRSTILVKNRIINVSNNPFEKGHILDLDRNPFGPGLDPCKEKPRFLSSRGLLTFHD